MPITIPVSDLESIKPLLKKMSGSLQSIQKDMSGFLETVQESLNKFYKNTKNEQKKYYEDMSKLDQTAKKDEKKAHILSLDEMKKKLEKAAGLEKKIFKIEQDLLNNREHQHTQHYKSQEKKLQVHLKKREDIEKLSQQYSIARNKDFYKRIDSSFSKFSKGAEKIAGTLDSALGVNLFGPLTKIATFFGGFAKNLFKMTMGGIKLIQTMKGEGLAKALKETKIGQAIVTTKEKMTKSAATAKEFLRKKEKKTPVPKIKKSTASKRDERGRFISSSERQKQGEDERKSDVRNKGLIGGAKDTTKGITSGFDMILGWFKKFWGFAVIKFLWQKAKWASGKVIDGLSALGKWAMGARTVVGAAQTVGGIAGGVGGATAAGGTAAGGVAAAGGTAAAVGTGLAVAGAIVAAAGAGVLLGTLARKWFADKWVQGLLYKDQKKYDKESQDKYGSQRSIDIANRLQSITEKTGIRATSDANKKRIMESKELWNKLTKEEQELVKKTSKPSASVTPAKNLQDPSKKKSELKDTSFSVYPKPGAWNEMVYPNKSKPPKDESKEPKKLAGGFPGENKQPKTFANLYGKITQRSTFTAGEAGEEYLSVLNKFQYEKLKSLLQSRLPAFAEENQKEKKSKAKSPPSAAVKPPKKQIELENKDEKKEKTSSPISENYYTLKDSSVHLEGLISSFKNRIFSMLKEYFKLTGKKPVINSAFRSAKDQIEAYNKDPNKAAKPGTSPHEKGTAMDIDSIYLNEMNEMGLLSKFAIRRPAKTKSGLPESWHASAQKGLYIPETKGTGNVLVHPQEKVLIEPKNQAESVFKYIDMGKKIVEATSSAAKSFSLSSTKDTPGKALKEYQPKTEETKTDKESIALLSKICDLLEKSQQSNTTKNEKETQKSRPTRGSGGSSSGGSTNYKTKSEIFPSDVLMTNMFAMMTQFNGEY